MNEEMKDNIDKNEYNYNISDNSIHSITSLENFSNKEKANFHEEIHKTIEKEIKRDSLINDMNFNLNNSKEENNLGGKKYSDLINNILLEDTILNSENNQTKTLETEERKLITPNFSPLNLKSDRKFEFPKDQQKSLNTLTLVLKSS